MERTKEPKRPAVHYCLCGAAHPGEQVKPGWYAIRKKGRKTMLERVICPDCLKRMGVKVDQN